MTPSTTGPAEVTWPATPCTLAEVLSAGLTEQALRGRLRRGSLRTVLRGVYASPDDEDSLEFRARCASKVTSPHHVLTDRTAAWIHGVDVLVTAELAKLPPIETCALRGHQPTKVTGTDGRTRDLRPDDIMTIHGVRVTTPVRTALDLGCCLRRREAFAALNAFARAYGLTRADYLRRLPRFRGRRGVIQLRELVGLVDPRLESQRESWVYLEIVTAGLPRPEPQVWIDVGGVPTYRLDLAYPDLRVCVEYDGFAAHESDPGQAEYDAARRRWLREHGWRIIVVRNGDFTGDRLAAWVGRLREALREAADAAYSNRRW